MNEAAKEARRLYKREWSRKNPDKVKAATERFFNKKAAEMAAAAAAAAGDPSADRQTDTGGGNHDRGQSDIC